MNPIRVAKLFINQPQTVHGTHLSRKNSPPFHYPVALPSNAAIRHYPNQSLKHMYAHTYALTGHLVTSNQGKTRFYALGKYQNRTPSGFISFLSTNNHIFLLASAKTPLVWLVRAFILCGVFFRFYPTSPLNHSQRSILQLALCTTPHLAVPHHATLGHRGVVYYSFVFAVHEILLIRSTLTQISVRRCARRTLQHFTTVVSLLCIITHHRHRR